MQSETASFWAPPRSHGKWGPVLPPHEETHACSQAERPAPPEQQIDFAQYGGVVQPDSQPDSGPVVLPGVMELPVAQYDELFSLKLWQPPVHYIRYVS